MTRYTGRLFYMVLWAAGGIALVWMCCALTRSEAQQAPDGSYWQAQAETLFQSRQSCEQVQIQLRLQLIEMRDQRDALQQRLKALEDTKPEASP